MKCKTLFDLTSNHTILKTSKSMAANPYFVCDTPSRDAFVMKHGEHWTLGQHLQYAGQGKLDEQAVRLLVKEYLGDPELVRMPYSQYRTSEGPRINFQHMYRYAVDFERSFRQGLIGFMFHRTWDDQKQIMKIHTILFGNI